MGYHPYATNKEDRTIKLLYQKYKTSLRKVF